MPRYREMYSGNDLKRGYDGRDKELLESLKTSEEEHNTLDKAVHNAGEQARRYPVDTFAIGAEARMAEMGRARQATLDAQANELAKQRLLARDRAREAVAKEKIQRMPTQDGEQIAA